MGVEALAAPPITASQLISHVQASWVPGAVPSPPRQPSTSGPAVQRGHTLTVHTQISPGNSLRAEKTQHPDCPPWL